MFKCNDPLAGLLKEFGYNLVAMPKPDIEPLDILVKNGDRLDRIGTLKDLFGRGETVALPRAKKDVPLAKELQNKKTNAINAKIGISILSNFLSSMKSKGKDAKDDKAAKDKKKSDYGGLFDKVHTYVFSYRNVLENRIDTIKLDAYIHDAVLNDKAVSTVKQLKNNEIFVITSTLKSNSFETELYDKSNVGINLGLPDLKKVIEADVSVGKESETSNKIVYQSEEHLVFGFKAVRLLYDKKTETYTLKTVEKTVMRDDEGLPVDLLQTDEAFFDI